VAAGYVEFGSPAVLAEQVACLWVNEPASDRLQRVIPDGCIDLVWLAGRDLVFVGADTSPKSVELPAGSPTVGIRFRPGAAGQLLGIPASEIRDLVVPAVEVWGEEAEALVESMHESTTRACRRSLAAAVGERIVEPDRVVVEAARILSEPRARVSDVADDLGVSERQLHRRTVDAVGYGPKMLARVARIRRLISLTRLPLAARALAAGYSSQAHMNDEVRRLTGVTPVRFLEDAELTAA
jgi:methylphosphotriester-DNA--protein-cysteine methyltransferase